MSGKTIGRAAVLIAAAALAGCSSIGTVNGVRMNATSAPDAAYCDKNPEICVALGLIVVAGAIFIVTEGDDNNNNSKPPPSLPP